MPFLQEIIHKFEEGEGVGRLRKFLAVLAVLALVAICNWREFRNFSTQEAMDSAQLARNISNGQGYKTLLVRPFSMYLLKEVNKDRMGIPQAGTRLDNSEVREMMHPDVSNPPVYPVLLAGWMKIYRGTLKGMDGVRNMLPKGVKKNLPQFNDSDSNPFWKKDGQQWWSPDDFLVSLFSQLLFFVMIVLVFFWAKKLFDARVAWTSAVLLLCSQCLWKFCFSGLSTMLLMVIFIWLAWVLTLMDQELREPKWKPNSVIVLAALAGLLTGIAGLTRYSFLWLIIPVAIFVIVLGGKRRVVLGLALISAFAIITIPWLARNYQLTHTFFGTSSYVMVEDTSLFPGQQLQRSLNPDLNNIVLNVIWFKLGANLQTILQNDLPRLGGSWITMLFLAGLLMGFVNVTLRRMRYFLLMCLGVFIFVQALGRTQLSEDSPDFNSENLLVVLVPLVTVFGVGMFFVLLDHMILPVQTIRYFVIGTFGVIVCLPLVFGLLSPRASAVVYPPYNPAFIEFISAWMKPDELVMSDMPWALAWYGNRQSILLTLNAQQDFIQVNDSEKTVSALYLSSLTLDKRFLSEWIHAGDLSWGSFVIDILVRKQVPPTFPLRKMSDGLMPDNLFLTDWERWNKSN